MFEMPTMGVCVGLREHVLVVVVFIENRGECLWDGTWLLVSTEDSITMYSVMMMMWLVVKWGET